MFTPQIINFYEKNSFELILKEFSSNIIAQAYGVLSVPYTYIKKIILKEELYEPPLLIVQTALLKHLENLTLAKNCKYIQLQTRKYEEKVFYETKGFKCIEAFPLWLEGRYNFLMEKNLVED